MSDEWVFEAKKRPAQELSNRVEKAELLRIERGFDDNGHLSQLTLSIRLLDTFGKTHDYRYALNSNEIGLYEGSPAGKEEILARMMDQGWAKMKKALYPYRYPETQEFASKIDAKDPMIIHPAALEKLTLKRQRWQMMLDGFLVGAVLLLLAKTFFHF